ncbi:hypothetical protein Tco_0440616, partial [Tanacetum coccineum]
GNTSSGLASSEDGIASAKTGIVIDKGIVSSGNSSEHTSWRLPFKFNPNISRNVSFSILTRNIKGYRVNIPKSKLVYCAVVKPQGAYNVASNMEQSLDTTKKPSPVDSSKNNIIINTR